MANIKTHRPVLLVVAMFGENTRNLDWACDRLSHEFGPIHLQCPDQPFNQTQFYEKSMGADLTKRWVAMRDLVPPDELPSYKQRTNLMEVELAETSSFAVARPLNVDPGYLTEAKLVLATTKDRDHRLYLGQGIFGEITLFYQQQRWNPSRWTYPDYQTPAVIKFLEECRQYLRSVYQTPTEN